MTKTDKGKPEPPIVLRDVLAGKPELVVHKADLTVTARALAKLLAEKCDYLFVHDGKPVIVELGEDDATPTMRPAGVNEIIIAAHKHCQPVHQKPNERHEVTLPDKVAEFYLAMPDEWRLRPLTSFANSPMLRDDGAIHCENGYDALTGVYIYNVPKITVPDKPSLDDAKSALKTLRHAFRTFAFADRKIVIENMNADGEAIDVKVVDLKQLPGKSESAHLVGLLTAVCRPSLLIAPAIGVRAADVSGSGTGKKLLLQGDALIAFGREMSSVALGHGGEFEKGLVAAVIRPDPGITIDNINGRRLQSETLCTVLTDRPAMVRVLGVSELKEVNPRQLICFNGNAFTIAEDLVRRNFVIELDAKVENPELRKFAGDFLTDIARQRPELLRAALTIWRRGRQTKPKSKGAPPLGGFEQWTAWIRDPLLALDCQDPVAQIANSKAADPKRLNTAEIFQTWWEHHSDNRIKSIDLHDSVQALIAPDPKKRSRQNINTRVGRLVGTRLAGFHLCSDQDNKKKGKKGLWTPTVYWLERTDENEATDATPAAEARPDAAADDPDDWQFNREPDDAAARPAAAEASGEPGTVASVPAFLTTPVKDELRGFGCTEEYILHVLPAEAHAFLAQRRKLAGVLTAWNTTIGLGQPRTVEQVFADAEMAGTSDGEASDELKRALAAVTNSADNMPLEQWLRENSGIEVGQLVLRETGTDKHGRPQWTLELRVEPAVPPLDADGWQFNREPAAPEASSDAIGARGFSEERIIEITPQDAPEPEPPLPSDPVKRWRKCFARLDPARDPCAGFRTGEWPRVHNVISTFLASPFAKQAADAGWTDRELFGVHPEVGVARPNACGALMTNAYGSPVTQVTPQLIRFANGLAVYKARLSVGNSVAVWDYSKPAVGERQQLARTPISESVTDSAEGEPGLEQPCAARRGRVQEKDGVFLHFCVECGRFGPYGYGVRLRAGQLGRWYCREHRPQGHEP